MAAAAALPPHGEPKPVYGAANDTWDL